MSDFDSVKLKNCTERTRKDHGFLGLEVQFYFEMNLHLLPYFVYASIYDKTERLIPAIAVCLRNRSALAVNCCLIIHC